MVNGCGEKATKFAVALSQPWKKLGGTKIGGGRDKQWVAPIGEDEGVGCWWLTLKCHKIA